MRTTITLEEDVEKRLKKLALKTGKSFKQVVNDTLRIGLVESKHKRKEKKSPFKVQPKDLGSKMNYDNIHELLEEIDN